MTSDAGPPARRSGPVDAAAATALAPVLARSREARLDRELAGGMSPEASATLAARAIRLTSTGFRRELAVSLQRILAAGEPPAVLRSQMTATRPSYADGAAMADRAEAG